MQPAAKHRLTAILVIAVAAAIIVSASFVLESRTPVPFVAELLRVGTGSIVESNNLTIPYVNFSLTYSSPTAIAPAALVITVLCSPACYSPFASNTSMTVSALELLYLSNSFPHWLVTSNGSMWTGYTATATNPDGRVVGGAAPSSADVATGVESGAVLTVTTPISGFQTGTAQSIRVTCTGHPGSVEGSLA